MDPRICNVLDHIEDNLSSKLTLNHLADIACMSPSHFHRTFRKATGCTPFKFIEEIKMNKAFQLLVSDSKNVQELTLLLGYEDYETFSRAFKKHHFFAPDDLKAIANKIKDELKVGSESIVLKTLDVKDISKINMNQVTEMLKQVLEEKDFSPEDLRNATLVYATPKTAGKVDASRLVKNKYVIAENKKIWQELLEHLQNGSD